MSRAIFKSDISMQQSVRDLLQSIFVLELLNPGKGLLVTSPWITADLGVIDNRLGTFDKILPEAGPRWVTLVEVLARLVSQGVELVVVTRPDETNAPFWNRLSSLCDGATCPPRHYHANLKNFHIKGILGDDYWLKGSMNLTFHGVEINEELVEFTVDTGDVAYARSEATNRWPYR